MTSLQRLTPGRLSLFKNKNGDKQTLNVLTLNKFLMGNFPDFDGVLTLITLFWPQFVSLILLGLQQVLSTDAFHFATAQPDVPAVGRVNPPPLQDEQFAS